MAEALHGAEDLKAAAMNALEDPSTSPTETNGEPPAPPTEPAGEKKPAPVAKAEPPAPSPESTASDSKEGSEEGGKDWKVPGERLQDEVKKRKEAEAKAEESDRKRQELEAKLAEAGSKNDPEDDDPDESDDVELKPEVKKAFEKEGFVRADKVDEIVEAKIAAREARAEQQNQAKQDVVELTKETADKGYPEFNIKEVLPIAEERFGKENLTKKQLRAAYYEKYADEIEDVMVKKAQATASAPTASAERPGGSPSVTEPEQPATTKDKTKAAIAAVVPD